MTALYAVLAFGFFIILIEGLPGAYRDTVKHRQRVKEAEDYRKIQAMMPDLVEVFTHFTFTINETVAPAVLRFAAAVEEVHAAELERRRER
jgi:hypothetical protein